MTMPERILDLIGSLGREAYYILDNCEESGPVGDSTFTVTKQDVDNLEGVLDSIQDLPHKESGYFLGPGAKLQAAVKQEFVPADVASAQVAAALSQMLEEIRRAALDTEREHQVIDEIFYPVIPIYARNALSRLIAEAEERGAKRERGRLQPWENYEGPIPDDDHPAAPVFGAGVTHALVLLGKTFGVQPITLQDGTEEFDGDVLATIWGIIREGLGDDEADALIAAIRARGGTDHDHG